MAQLILTEEQAKLLAEAKEPVVIRGPDGRALGSVSFPGPPLVVDRDWTVEELQEMRRLAETEPWYDGDQIQAMFRALEAEWQRTGGFDVDYAEAFIEWRSTGRSE